MTQFHFSAAGRRAWPMSFFTKTLHSLAAMYHTLDTVAMPEFWPLSQNGRLYHRRRRQKAVAETAETARFPFWFFFFFFALEQYGRVDCGCLRHFAGRGGSCRASTLYFAAADDAALYCSGEVAGEDMPATKVLACRRWFKSRC